MKDRGHLWAIVLAGGEGTRVRALTTGADGLSVPKQFFAVDGERTMVRHAIERAHKLVPATRVVVIVAERHRQWWRTELADLAEENIVVQPSNRGTAAGILLPLLEILRRDPMARIAVFPSDHHVEDQEVMREAIVDAIQAAQTRDPRVVLLGIAPGAPETDYGWIVPAAQIGAGPACGVAAFVEKPDRATARGLLRRGALLNTFVFVATARALLELFEDTVPWLVEAFGGPDLETLYGTLPDCDFSREVLGAASERLAVVPVATCGWVDLGTPGRLARFQLGTGRPSAHPGDRPPGQA